MGFDFFLCDVEDSCFRFFSFALELFFAFGVAACNDAVLLVGFAAAAAPKKLFIVFLSVVAHLIALSLIGEKGSSTNEEISP